MYTRFNWNRDGYEKNEIIYYAINFEIGLKSTIFRSLYFIEKFSNYISLIILAYYSSHSYFSKRNQRVSNNYIALLFHRRTTRGRFFLDERREKKEERNEKEQSETSIQIESSIVIIVTLDDDFRCCNYSLSFSLFIQIIVSTSKEKI